MKLIDYKWSLVQAETRWPVLLCSPPWISSTSPQDNHVVASMLHISFFPELDLPMHVASSSLICLSILGTVIRGGRRQRTAALATANNNVKKMANLKNRRDASKLGLYAASAGPLLWIVSSLTSSSLHFPSCIWSVIQKHETQISQAVDHLLVSGNYKSACFKMNNKRSDGPETPSEKYLVLFKVCACQI